MRPLIPLVFALLNILSLGCQGGGPATPKETNAPATPPPDVSAVQFTPIRSESGVVDGPIGVWWLSHDGDAATLSPMRTAVAQGDEFALPINAFLEPGSLKLISSTPVPEGVDYRVSFTHPFPMPVDLARPATAQKRTDLFITDVHLVILADGTSEFFDGEITLNPNVVQNADGYRQVSPMLDPTSFGITQANTFPYRTLSAYDPLDANGNYSATEAWTASNLLTARGYDIVPQGATVETIVRGPATLPSGMAVVLMARYMDPRAGATVHQRIANRLPDPDDASAQRYYLPEACGDLQVIELVVEGELVEGSDVETATLRARVRDWDHAATIATTFPDLSNPTHIRRSSNPFNIAADIPSLKTTPYTGNQTGPSTGQLLEWTDKFMAIRNTDRIFAPPPGETAQVPGLLRIEDSQDFSAIYTLLDADLTPLPGEGLRPSTRYQTFTLPIRSTKIPPVITGAFPNGGMSGEQLTFGITSSGGTPTVWTWNFGGGATPNTASIASPTVLLGAEGTYNATVRVGNAYGLSDPFPFEITIGMIPQITGVTPPALADYAGKNAAFTVQTTGGAPAGWNWNFGGGANPPASTAQTPIVTLTNPGTHTGSIQVTNAFGASELVEFDFTVYAATAPSVIDVQPTGVIGLTGNPVIFSASTLGQVESYAWNFGGGATPNTSTDATPNVSLGAIGIYNGSLIVSNPYGASAAFPFAFSVASGPVPTILSVNPTGNLGFPGTPIQFTVNATNSPTGYSWSFGGGANPNTSTEVSPTVTLSSLGSFQGTVTVSNANGSSTPFPFVYQVSEASTAWSRVVGGQSAILPRSVATDGAGNSYFVGIFQQSIDFDPGPGTEILSAASGWGGYLVKLSPVGEMIFARRWGGVAGDNFYTYDLIFDEERSILHLIGYWKGTADFDPGPGQQLRTSPSSSGNSGFWLQLTTGGDYLRLYEFGGANGNLSLAGIVDHPDGGVALSGFWDGTVDLDPGPGTTTRVSSPGEYDPCLIRMTEEGTLAWVSTWESSGYQLGGEVVADNSRNVYWAWNWGGTTYVESFDVDGFLRWSTDISGDWAAIYRMRYMPAGYIRAIGVFTGTVDFNPGPGGQNLTGNTDLFVWDFATDNDLVRVGKITNEGNHSSGMDLVIDDAGISYITGAAVAGDMFDFDPGNGVQEYTFDTASGWVIRLSEQGEYEQLYAWEGGTDVDTARLALVGDSEIVTTGTFSGTVDFDPGPGVDLKTNTDVSNALYFSRFATQ